MIYLNLFSFLFERIDFESNGRYKFWYSDEYTTIDTFKYLSLVMDFTCPQKVS